MNIAYAEGDLVYHALAAGGSDELCGNAAYQLSLEDCVLLTTP